ncbi:transmembrane Fragile-X-F-associated protein [Actinidia rufa]|uniref:Transmembrane Fragile-X-F-associated protein n=1 Tax=Actinidia rufa TaxID=165716 RepID=A0A7J0GZ80_9ERIC|nr:transmembrane Fragile-X-F-associated protein [Actinidia rufa]
MLVQRRAMSWRRVGKALQAAAAHGLLFSFTLFLVLKLDRVVSCSWWIVFTPLWLFHVVVARGRFSLPAPSMPSDRRWAPFHAVMATPLLLAFELLLCIYLESSYAMNMKIVFLPLLAFEAAVLVDNVRMCRALMPGDEEVVSDEAIWETLPDFERLIRVSAALLGCNIHGLLHFCDRIYSPKAICIAECFAFLICTKWYNPAIHRHSHLREVGSSSSMIRYLDWNSGMVVSSDEEQQQGGICNLQDIGGHIMKIPLIGFQILLFMRLEGTTTRARHIPISVVFSPLLLLQGAGVLFSIYRSIERTILLLRSGAGTGRYFIISSKVRDCFEFMLHGSRLLGWWSIDEGSRKEQAQLYYAGASGYNTFSPDIVKKMPKSDLTEEIWRLQAALSEQREITKFNQQEYEKATKLLASFDNCDRIGRISNEEKVLCRVCFEQQINIVLLPCRHHILCSTCCEKCKRCPICRVSIEERLPVSDV